MSPPRLRAASPPLLALLAVAPSACTESAPPLSDAGLLIVGASSRVRVTEEPPGAACAEGGQRLEVGVDDDGDGVLDDEEVDGEPSFLCHGEGAEAVAPSLVLVREEPPGPACSHGGQRVEAGRDTDGDGLLDAAEVETSAVACAGAPGADGAAALVEALPATGCAEGGVLVKVGLDQDGDGALDDGEVALAREVCAGASGADAPDAGGGGEVLVDVVEEPAGVPCADGGQRVRIGSDEDGDGLLDEEEVEETAVVCDGLPGDSGPIEGNGAGASEGSAAAPVLLELGAFDGAPAPRVATVGAGGTSYYAFVAGGVTDASVAAAPHTLGLFGAESLLAVSLFTDDAAGSAVEVVCTSADDEGFSRACRTAPLERGRTYVLALRDLGNMPSSLFLTVSLGADEGSASSPHGLVLGGQACAVRGGGQSSYAFVPAAAGPHTLSVEGLLGREQEPPRLAWSLYEGDEAREDRLLWSCPALGAGADVACATPALVAGESYVVSVEEQAGFGGLYDVVVSAGDALTPAAALSTQTVLPDVLPGPFTVQFQAETAGRYTVDLYHAVSTQWSLYADVRDLEGDAAIFRCDYRGCATPPLEAGRTYYVRGGKTSLGPSDVIVTVVPRGGPEGSLDAPLELSLGAAHEGSAGHAAEDESFYRFAAPSTAPYTARVALDSPEYPPRCTFYEDAGFAAPASRTRAVTDGACISEVLEAGRTYYLKLDTNSGTAVTYTLTLEEGDTVTPALSLGAGPAVVDIPAGETVLLQVPSTTAPWRLSFTGAVGPLQRRVWGGLPANRDNTGYLERCEGSHVSSDASDCELVAGLKDGVSYVELVDTSGAPNQVSIHLEEHPVVDLTLGAAASGDPLPPGGSRWYRFSNATLGYYEAVLARQSGGAFYAELHDPGMGQVHYTYSLGGNNAQTFHLAVPWTTQTSALLPQTWFFLVENRTTSPDLVVDVTLQERP